MRVVDGSRTRDAGADGAAREDRTVRRVAAVLGVLAVSLWVAGALHLAGVVTGRGAPFDADHAGLAEEAIGVVLAVGASALWRSGPQARTAGLWAVGFGIVGFGVGLTITTQGGHWPDIAYHLVGLPLLITCFAALLRTDPAGARSIRR